jgi:hypothetical protein
MLVGVVFILIGVGAVALLPWNLKVRLAWYERVVPWADRATLRRFEIGGAVASSIGFVTAGLLILTASPAVFAVFATAWAVGSLWILGFAVFEKGIDRFPAPLVMRLALASMGVAIILLSLSFLAYDRSSSGLGMSLLWFSTGAIFSLTLMFVGLWFHCVGRISEQDPSLGLGLSSSALKGIGYAFCFAAAVILCGGTVLAVLPP